MKKKMLRIIAVSVCLIMALSGCGGNEENVSNINGGEKSLTHKVCDEPLELTVLQTDKYVKHEENIYSEAFKRTNVNLKFELGENVTDFAQAMSLAVASKKLPDIMYSASVDKFIEYGMMGVLTPLNDLIDKYAPNYKKFLEENPDVKRFTTADDGNIYWIPFIQELETTNGWFIREDWLEKLNLKAPDTVDEFYDVMVAFKTKDPNGNGKADEVPYFSSKTGPVSVLDDFTGLFDARTKFRYENGKVSYGPLEPEFKEMMITVTKWYQEGLLDKEIFTRKLQREYFLGNDLGGITHDWFTSTSSFNEIFKDEVPGLKFKAFPPPTNSKGLKMETSKRDKITTEGWGITVQNEHPVETMKYFDYWWTEQGMRDASFGVEGITYTMVDGEPKLTDLVLNSTDPTPMALLNEYRDATHYGTKTMAAVEMNLAHPYAQEGMQMYIDGGYYPKEEVYLRYTEEETKARSKYKGQVETYLAETVQKWLLGNEKIEETYDQFINEMKSLGADEYTAIEQAAYTRSLAK